MYLIYSERHYLWNLAVRAIDKDVEFENASVKTKLVWRRHLKHSVVLKQLW